MSRTYLTVLWGRICAVERMDCELRRLGGYDTWSTSVDHNEFGLVGADDQSTALCGRNNGRGRRTTRTIV